MNCAECRDNLVACAEGLLEHEGSLACQAHLETCAACQAEFKAITGLRQKLIARSRAAAKVSLVEPVMRQVREVSEKQESHSIMSKLFTRWGFGLSAAAGAAAIVLVTLVLLPQTKATAAEVLARGAKAVARLTSIHLRGQLRTDPTDNFSYINQHCDFAPIELWKQFGSDLKWRVEKPGRLVLMDGQSTTLYIPGPKIGNRYEVRSESAFDTTWLHNIANLSQTISNELVNAVAKGWKLELNDVPGPDGKRQSVVTIHATSGLPDTDYLKNSFFDLADTRRVFRFNAQTELLEAVQIYQVRPAGEVLIFDLNRIDYNQPLDPKLWQLDLPAGVSWFHEAQKLPDNEIYAAMTVEQAARAFFEACGREDWVEAGKFMSTLTPGFKKNMGGVEIITLGESFATLAFGARTNLQRFVPYEIKLRPQEVNVRLSNDNPAKRFVVTGICDANFEILEDFPWTNEPPVLPVGEAGNRMLPVEVFKTLIAASAKLDWTEIEKFMPGAAVEKLRRQVEEAQQSGVDLRNLIPEFEVGEASWSAEKSAWFVKARMAHVKKWNIALRKDNPAGRWQVDGGI